MADHLDLRARPHDAGEEALPLPSGTPVYESLTSRFVDFNRLRATLSETGYSGYVRLVAPSVHGVMLFRNGKIVDSLRREHGRTLHGADALREIERTVSEGAGVLDVVDLQADLVDGLHHLASGVATYPDLRASWVNPDGLLKFLETRHFTGVVSVRSARGSGVIMLHDGEVSGAFTTESREMGDDPSTVLALCSDPDAAIEVHAAGRRSDEAGAPPLVPIFEPVGQG